MSALEPLPVFFRDLLIVCFWPGVDHQPDQESL